MSRHTSQQSSYIEEDAYDSAYSEASRDPLDDFLDRYTVDFDPEYRLKLKKQFKNVALAASVGVGGPALLITVKPQYEDRDCCWWRRVVLNPQKQGISLYTRKFRIGNLVDLQLEAHSTSSQRLGVSWRVFPKWSKSGSSKLTYKYKNSVSEQLKFRATLRCDLGWPELGGQIGSGVTRSMEYEQGYCHVDVPKLELVYNLDARPKALAAAADRKQGGLAFSTIDEDDEDA